MEVALAYAGLKHSGNDFLNISQSGHTINCFNSRDMMSIYSWNNQETLPGEILNLYAKFLFEASVLSFINANKS